MKKINDHINNAEGFNNSDELFKHLENPWDKSKDEIWGRLSEKLEVPIKPKTRTLKLIVTYSAAAIIFLAIGITLFARFYTKDIYCPAGEHLSMTLPGGSEVELNAETSFEYNPYWWFIARKTKVEGEAFFKVSKGNKFEVISVKGTTRVLGTSFNIYARNSEYKVTCVSGSVQVQAKKLREKVVLKPNQEAVLVGSNGLEVKKEVPAVQAKAWVDDKFIFTSCPLVEVFNEVERQYGVRITIEQDLNDSYTGGFDKGAGIESVLYKICRPHELSFEKKNDNTYLIIHK